MVAKRFIRGAAFALACGSAVVAGTVDARQISYATGFPPGSVGAEAAKAYAETVKEHSGGEMDVKIYAMSLLNFQETSAGLKDGLADSGVILLPYFHRQFVHSNLITELTMLLNLSEADPVTMSAAYAGAAAEFIFQHCPECQAEFRAQNQVYAGQAASAPYYLLCTKPVTTPADLKGLRVRTGSPQWARWASEMGAVSVSISATETFEALNQGVITCSISAYSDLRNFNLSGTVTDITAGQPGGVGAGITMNNVNAKTWRSLTAKQREAVLRGSSVLAAQFVWLYAEEADRALKASMQKGDVKLHQPSAELEAATRAFIEKDMNVIAENYRQLGVQRGQEMVDSFRPILSKWMDLVKDVKTSDQLADIYWKEIYSKIDVNQYGL